MKYFFFLFVAGLLAFPNFVNAASFCLAGPALPPQCIYDDVQVCLKATEPPNTTCVINPETYIAYTGNSEYCVAKSSKTALCYYVDRDQCNQEAQRSQSICVQRPLTEDNKGVYQYDQRIQRN